MHGRISISSLHVYDDSGAGPAFEKGGEDQNCVNFSRDYKVYARSARNFGKKAIKSTIFELQQKKLYIFGVAQNF